MGLLDKVLGAIGLERVVNRVADKVLGEPPELALERQKAEDAHEIAQANAETERLKALWEFIKTYEGAASEVPKAIVWLRAVPRPILVMLSFVLVFWAHFVGKEIGPTSTAGIITLALLFSFLGTKLNRDMRL